MFSDSGDFLFSIEILVNLDDNLLSSLIVFLAEVKDIVGSCDYLGGVLVEVIVCYILNLFLDPVEDLLGVIVDVFGVVPGETAEDDFFIVLFEGDAGGENEEGDEEVKIF